MRRRLSRLVLAVTSLVVVAFTIPLAALVQRDADAAARTEAENLAQSVASGIVRLVADEGVDALTASDPSLPAGIGLVYPSGRTSGDVTDAELALAAQAADDQQALSAYTVDGWALALPVLTRDGAVVVTVSVTDAELRSGVTEAWLLLIGLGIVLVGVSLLLADRLGRSVTTSVGRLGEAARSLAAGDLDTRVAVDDPPELAAVADAFNEMAPRLQALIDQEREDVADLSHRLRTPMARLRLQAERVEDPEVRQALFDNLDRVDRTVDEVIAEARHRPERERPLVVDVGGFLRERAAFWEVLADEQGRTMTVGIDQLDGVAVGASEVELTAALDAVLGNVFDHTPEGTGFSISAGRSGEHVIVTVSDDGAGFPTGLDPLARGVSGGGSTGLGLDIARRTAERAGGTLRAGRSRSGGASVELRLPISRGS